MEVELIVPLSPVPAVEEGADSPPLPLFFEVAVAEVVAVEAVEIPPLL